MSTSTTFHAGLHKGTGTPLDCSGVDAHGRQHRFETPEAVESGVRDVAGHLHAITELVGRQLERLSSVTSEEDRSVIAFEAAATLREALRDVRAPAEALARAEITASLDREVNGWVQINAERRQQLLGRPHPPTQLVEDSWVNDRARETTIPFVQVFTSTSADGTEVRDVLWPGGAYSSSAWIRDAAVNAHRWSSIFAM